MLLGFTPSNTLWRREETSLRLISSLLLRNKARNMHLASKSSVTRLAVYMCGVCVRACLFSDAAQAVEHDFKSKTVLSPAVPTFSKKMCKHANLTLPMAGKRRKLRRPKASQSVMQQLGQPELSTMRSTTGLCARRVATRIRHGTL